MNIILGTTSSIKLSAVRTAMNETGWNGTLSNVSIPSGVPEQPIEEETEQGARNRAFGASERDTGAIAIGIENGIRCINGQWEDWAVIAIRLPSGEFRIFNSDAVCIPSEIVYDARARNVTAGQIIAEQYGTPSDDPHSFLTNERDSRETILTRALVTALIAVSRQLPACL